MPPVISVVVPVYRGETCLDELYRRLVQALEPAVTSFEIVLVEDCGPDRAWTRIRKLATGDPRVRGVQFSRNFGQHRAITAGIDAARGDWIVVMDCDLQDQPEEIPRLYQAAITQGVDIVLARRRRRRDGVVKRATSAAFYSVFRYLTEIDYDGTVGNFRIMSRQVGDSFRDVREQMRFFGGIVTWLGFRVGSIDVQHAERFAGETSYTWRKLIDLAVQTIVAHSDKPLRLAIRVGFVMAVGALLGGVWVLIAALDGRIAVMGWASLMVSLYFLSGVILAFMGVLGLYLGRVFDEVKGRPLYVIRETTFRE
ncbi:MAG TPA: glycosyltransferase [Gemmatimonadaceae bacterium]|nr:glycosyltransferase [Gemmatimonadaceae bacterium]